MWANWFYKMTCKESNNKKEPDVIHSLNIIDPSFLENAIQTSQDVYTYAKKLKFACELLVERHVDATPLVNHVAQVYVREIWEELHRGETSYEPVIDEYEYSSFMDIMETLQNAGKVSNVNPYLIQY